jgi:hypothetical protein
MGASGTTDLALEAHLHESTLGTAIEDSAEIEGILGT